MTYGDELEALTKDLKEQMKEEVGFGWQTPGAAGLWWLLNRGPHVRTRDDENFR